jgi:hypothetical protein
VRGSTHRIAPAPTSPRLPSRCGRLYYPCRDFSSTVIDCSRYQTSTSELRAWPRGVCVSRRLQTRENLKARRTEQEIEARPRRNRRAN